MSSHESIRRHFIALTKCPTDSEIVVDALKRVIELSPLALVTARFDATRRSALHICIERKFVNKALLMLNNGASLDATDVVWAMLMCLACSIASI